jgi:hypothetical protein
MWSLACDTVYSCSWIPTFHITILPPSSGIKCTCLNRQAVRPKWRYNLGSVPCPRPFWCPVLLGLTNTIFSKVTFSVYHHQASL